MGKIKFLKKERVKKLPKEPGVYVFKNKGVLYIGKSANIQNRVQNHFYQPRLRQGYGGQAGLRDNFFINKVKHVGFIKTDSEIEALILEAKLIKKYQPKYNVLWRDDKNYFYVGTTQEDFPRIFITHQPKLQANYVGPFVDGKALKKTLKVLRKIFPYRTCKTFPKRACLWYQLDRCLGPCLLQSKASQQITLTKIKRECQKNSKNVLKILQGKKTQVVDRLKKEMKKAVKVRDFEGAAKIRDKIFALQKTLSNVKIFRIREEKIKYSDTEKELKKLLKTRERIKRIEAYDVSNISGKLATGAMVTFLNGKPVKKYYRKFKIKISTKPDDVGMLKECLIRRFKHPEWGEPDLILIDGGRAQLNAALGCLRSGLKHDRDIKVMAIAKRKNELYIEERKPILLKKLPREVFNLILQLRDEAHRFASAYHKKLRRRKLIE